MLEVTDIAKKFSPPISLKKLFTPWIPALEPATALQNISFKLPKGAVLAILGPNGAGKTTLLKILSTLILPDHGSFRINGLVSGKDDEKIKTNIGLLASCERSFYWRLTGRQNLEFFAALYGIPAQKRKEKIDELFGLFGIDFGDKRFDSYSTGMQQKIGLIRAIIHEPGLLLLDEPTKSLDYTAAMEFRSFVKRNLAKEQGKTVVFTTHQMDEALDFADVLMILDKGLIKAFGTIEDLRKLAKDPLASLGKLFLELTKGPDL